MDVWFENYAKIKGASIFTPDLSRLHQKPYQAGHRNIPLNKLTSLELQALYKKLLEGGRVERVESKNKPKGLSPKTVLAISTRSFPPL